MNQTNNSDELVKRIKNKRQNISGYLQNLRPVGTRLTNFNIICGAIATVLTATPAITGKPLIEVFGGADPNSVTWRILFAIAAVFSLLSTIAANLYKSHDIATRLGKAEACDAKLEGLEILLELNQITVKDAADKYTLYISEIPFVTTDSNPVRKYSSLDIVTGEIFEPQSNQAVEKTFQCSILVENLGAGCHLWLVVEKGSLMWPKERELHLGEDGKWKGIVREDSQADETFSLSLFSASDKANKRIRRWLDNGDTTGDYRPLSRLPGTRRIASVDGLHMKKAG